MIKVSKYSLQSYRKKTVGEPTNDDIGTAVQVV